MKKLLLLITFILLATSAFALEELDQLAELEGQEVPGPLRSLLNNQRVNIHVTENSGETLTIGVAIEKHKVTETSTTA